MESSKIEVATAISLEGVAMRYGPIEALAPLTLTIGQGETVALIGPSGSGKTTLLLLVAGTLQPTFGRVALHGQELAKMHPGRELAHLVGMMHQQFDLVHNLSALQNILAGRLGQWSLIRSLVSLISPREKDIGLSALERVGIASRAYLRAGKLSGGEQQRVAMARLLVQDPQIMLADEPVASLDPARGDELIRLLVELTIGSGKTLVVSMHSVEMAQRYFSRFIGLRNGRVEFDLPSQEVTDNLLHELYVLEGLRDEA